MNENSYTIAYMEREFFGNTFKKTQKLLSVCSDSTRLKILVILYESGESSVGDIVLESKCSQSLISHQLKILKDNELVKYRKVGLRVYYSLKDKHIEDLLKLIKDHVEEK